MAKTTLKLNLTTEEKAKLRANRFKIADIATMDTADIQRTLQVPPVRAKELYALAEFQSIPSVGIKFAEDLISIGYYSLADIKHKDGPALIQELELSAGVWIDPCVEDQCRLVVHYANHKDTTMNWWDFTEERKAYRAQHGYPAERPKAPWHEMDKDKKG